MTNSVDNTATWEYYAVFAAYGPRRIMEIVREVKAHGGKTVGVNPLCLIMHSPKEIGEKLGLTIWC